MALDERALLPLNLQVRAAVAMIFGVLPKLALFREQLAQLFDFDLVAFDKLEDCALALLHAQVSARIGARLERSG